MKEEYLSLIRHILTVGGTLLVSKGILDEATLGTVIGAIVTLVGVVGGYISSRRKSAEIKYLQASILSLRK